MRVGNIFYRGTPMTERLHRKDMEKPQRPAKHGYLTVDELLNSGVSEAFRNIRAKLIFSSPDKELKTMLVTSALPREGKTFNSICLGIAMADAGKRVLVIDADQRRPAIAKAFSLSSSAESIGLSSLIMKRVPPEDAIVRSSVDNLSVLPCGPKSPNPSELLGSESMVGLLKELSSAFDLLILDTPPILGLADTLNMAPKVDGCLLVIRYAKTSYKAVVKAKEAIEMVQGNIMGAILNSTKTQSFGYGYGYGYDYDYDYGYGYGHKGYHADRDGEEEVSENLTKKIEPAGAKLKRRGIFRRRKK